MKKLFSALAGTILLLPVHTNSQTLRGVSFFSPRSQSVNAARELVGWHPFIHRYGMDSIYGAFTVTSAYNLSVRPARIADALFGTDTLFISGSQIINRDPNDILADYFGLSPKFQSIVNLDPFIQNVSLVFNAYVGFDSLLEGLYLQVHAPAVWTKWDLQLCEKVLSTGIATPFPAQYMDEGAITAPVTSFKSAIKGGVTFGQMTEGLKFGKICGSQTKSGLSDLQIALGWDFISREHGHLGINLRMAAPTGSRPDSELLFEPIVGNGKHWEFGFGVSGRVLLWEMDGEQELSLFADTNFTHLFNAQQRRSFDLKPNGFGSRYILVKEFDSVGNYIGTLAPLINKTTLCCDVKIDFQADIVVMFAYSYRGFLFDFGYNGWIRSKEKISLKECFPEDRFGLKGILNVVTGANQLTPITQSTATLWGNEFDEQSMVVDANAPIFIREFDIDLRSAASPRLITHKIFMHVGHSWHEGRENGIIPFWGIGGEIEFEGINERNTVNPDKNTLSQWGIWSKGGIAF